MYNEIQKMINNTIDQQPKPTLATITKVHTDQEHIDCETNLGTLEYILCIGTPTKGNKGILIPLDDESLIIITK